MTTYVFKQSEPGLWTIGYFDENNKWCPICDHDSKQNAIDQVAYLNGSSKADPTLKQIVNELQEIANILVDIGVILKSKL